MSKLFTLKEWLTVPEAARHLSRLINEEVADADVLRLALDGRLTLSVNFVNHARANPGKIVHMDEIEWTEFPSIFSENDAPPIRIPDGLQLDDGRWIKLEEKVVTLNGVWDLAMIGSEALDVEHEYQMLTGGPSVTLVGLEGAFVSSESGLMCRLCESWGDNEYMPGSSARLKRLEQAELVNAMTPEEVNVIHEKFKQEKKAFREKWKEMAEHNRYYPAGGLPEDGVLVVRSKNLTAFVSSLDMKQPRVEDMNYEESKFIDKIKFFFEMESWDAKMAIRLLCDIYPDQFESGGETFDYTLTGDLLAKHSARDRIRTMLGVHRFADYDLFIEKYWSIKELWESRLEKPERMAPGKWVKWAQEKGYDVPWLEWATSSGLIGKPSLTEGISGRELENAAQSEPLSGEKLSTKERNSLLKIIAALLSVSGLKGETFKQAEGIVRAASEVGIKVSVNTVDKYLKEATSIDK